MVRVLATAVCLACCLAAAAGAAVHTVAPDGGGDFATIQAALDGAAEGDVVELAAGVYTGADNRNLDPAGKTLTVRSAGGDPAACILDCQGVAGTTRRGFRFHSGEGRDFVVAGITIANGSAAPNGAGVSCTGGAAPTFENCVLENGTASENGGAIYCSSGADPLFVDCVIRNNVASFYGGGLRAISASADFTRCRIAGNEGNGGGGLSYYRDGTPAIVDCVFADNFGHRGGGIFLFDSQAAVTGCEFTGNACYAEGGGIDSVESQLTVTGCRFVGNHAGEFGGAISSGDALTNPSGWLVLADCLLAGNSSQRGGGVHAQYSDVTITSCTLVDNEGGDWTGCIADQLGQAGNISERPDFCDAEHGDYTLQLDSPCANASCGFMGSEPVACDTPLAAPPVASYPARLLPLYPNPTGGGATVAWDLRRGGEVLVQVISVRGERLWRARTRAGRGPGSLVWNGRDTAGRPLAAGSYLVQLVVDGRPAGSETVVLTR